MNTILLSNGTETTSARVNTYALDDRRVPAALATAALRRLGGNLDSAAYLDGELVTVERRGDGALAVRRAA